MRKIIVSARISMDGVMQAPSGPAEDVDEGFKFGGWAKPSQDQDCSEELERLFLGEKYDLLLGRKTYEIFARYWPHQVWEDVPNGGIPKVFNAIRKYVVSGSGEVDRPGRARCSCATPPMHSDCGTKTGPIFCLLVSTRA